MRLIEKKNDSVGVTVDNGAVMNYASVAGQNGAIYGFTLALSNGSVMATKGRLVVQGFTFETLETEELYDLDSYTPESTAEQSLYLRITWDSTSRDAVFTYVVKPSSEYVANTQIQENISGSYFYKLCTFSKSGAAITSFTSKVSVIYFGGSGGDSSGIVTPQPVLSVVSKKSGTAGVPSLYNGYLMIGNADEYVSLASSYTLKFEFYRRITNGHYRSSSAGTTKMWTKKSQWIRSFAGATYGSIHTSTVPFSALYDAEITGGSIQYKLAICPIKTIIDAFFKDVTTGTAITNATIPNKIRATRSKKMRATIPNRYRYNFLEFAYKAVVYNQAGKVIGESAMSNCVFIKPNPEVLTMARGGLTIKCL